MNRTLSKYMIKKKKNHITINIIILISIISITLTDSNSDNKKQWPFQIYDSNFFITATH